MTAFDPIRRATIFARMLDRVYCYAAIRGYWALAGLILRYRCPGGDGWARDCIKAGNCGCDNATRF